MHWTAVRRFAAVAAVTAAVGISVVAQDITSQDLLDGLANPSRWLTYSGTYDGQRYSPLTQITPANAGQLTAVWTFQTGIAGHHFETTPLVIDGILYVTGPLNHAWAIETKTGKQLWHYQRQLPAVDQL